MSNSNFLALVAAALLASISDTLRVLAITFWVLEGSDYSPLVHLMLLLVGFPDDHVNS